MQAPVGAYSDREGYPQMAILFDHFLSRFSPRKELVARIEEYQKEAEKHGPDQRQWELELAYAKGCLARHDAVPQAVKDRLSRTVTR
jgi:hypothetical protein